MKFQKWREISVQPREAAQSGRLPGLFEFFPFGKFADSILWDRERNLYGGQPNSARGYPIPPVEGLGYNGARPDAGRTFVQPPETHA